MNERAREFATHGFCRRLGHLVQAIDTVYAKLPPELDEIPDRERVVAAVIAIQSFVLNTFGCLDNLAWIWVCEKNVRKADGSALDPKWVGLGRQNRQVRRSFSREFCAYLDSRQEWFDNLKNFRDSLAHRIPLYIPPYVVTPNNLEEYNRLEVVMKDALRRADLESYARIELEQQRLAHFRPWMTHSRTENAPTVLFHVQLLQDYVTIDEFGRMMLEELER